MYWMRIERQMDRYKMRDKETEKHRERATNNLAR